MSRDELGPELPGMRCVQWIGSGGFSDVFLYEQDQPKLKLAVKLLRAEGLDDVQRQQFAAEADAMAELAEHPYIVPVLRAGTSPDGRPYLSMRYYPPPDLGARVAENQLSVPDALRTGIQLASAVETAHRAGIIHRDIKPANVLMSSYGEPGLTDFGIAGRGERGETDDNVGVSMPWSPPEILSAKSNGSPTSDVYSLAATMWNLLVGHAPFEIHGDNSERAMFARIMHSKPPATGRAEVPSSLDRLLQQAMAKVPAHRPQSALEFARHLQRVEQELRLPRTEIVVLETEAPLPLAQATPPTVVGVEADEGVTMLRRPKNVRAQESPSTAPTAAPEQAFDLTARRPQRAGATSVRADETARRPAKARPQPDDVRTTPEAPPPGRRRTRTGAVVVALLVAAISIGAVLANGDDDKPGAPVSLAPSGPQDDDDVIDGIDLVMTPAITGSLVGGTASFSAQPEQPTDEFQWQVRLPGEEYSPVDQGGNPRAIRVPVNNAAPGSQVCARLFVRRAGQVSDPGDKCITVP